MNKKLMLRKATVKVSKSPRIYVHYIYKRAYKKFISFFGIGVHIETDAKKILLTQKQAFIEKSIIFTQSL